MASRHLRMSVNFLAFLVILLTVFSQVAEARVKRSVTYNSALTLLSVERSPSPDGATFKVRFTKIADGLIFRVQDNIEAPRAPTVVEDADGNYTSSFQASTSQLPLWFIVGDADFRHMVAINLDNSENSSAEQTIAELPVIHLSPASEAVYEPQEDIIVTAFVPRNSQTGEVISNFRKMFSGLDLNTMTMYYDLEDDDVFTLGQPVETAEKIQASMTIHTSTRRISGYLQLSTDVYNTGGPLVSYIQVSRSILVRPSNQTGPYPPGYLTIMGGFSSDISPNGNPLLKCNIGHQCLFSCVAIGESISSMELKEVQSDQSLSDVPYAATGPDILGNSRDIYWKFQADGNSGDSNGISTFQCKVTDETNNEEVTKRFDVKVIIPAIVDPAESMVTVEDVPMCANVKRVTFKCAIKGRPLPEVVFYGGSTGQFSLYYDSPTDVISTGPDEAVAIKAVTIDASNLADAIQSISVGRDSSPSCNIYADQLGDSTTYDFYRNLC